MPQASDELRQVMIDRFGSIDTQGPEGYLKLHGYKLNCDWTWTKTGVNALDGMPRVAWLCLLFLAQEWDYGAVTPAQLAVTIT